MASKDILGTQDRLCFLLNALGLEKSCSGLSRVCTNAPFTAGSTPSTTSTAHAECHCQKIFWKILWAAMPATPNHFLHIELQKVSGNPPDIEFAGHVRPTS
jgi:hypothetical protein